MPASIFKNIGGTAVLFSSTDFIFWFLPAFVLLLLVLRFLPRTIQLVGIAASSLYLYAYHVPIYIWLIAGSALANFVIAGFVTRSRWIFAFGIAANLALLGYFKYADFFIETWNAAAGDSVAALHVILPLAISFITFEQIAFLSDVRAKRADRGSFLEYIAFITLYPKLIAGPIIRYTEVLPQLRERLTRLPEKLFTGLCIFSIGLFNKVVLADSLTPIIDPVYAKAAAGLVPAADAVLATLAYSTRILFDFSGYSTMAIGLAWMFGVRLPINFMSPYRSTSLIDFWRRWHISLSRFLRDYLYIPLGGGRHGEFARYRNVIIVMLLGGLWHGAGWTFVAWGALHGFGLAINHGWRSLAPAALRTRLSWIGWPLTITTVVVAWVFFNAHDFTTAFHILASLNNWSPATITNQQTLLIVATWAFALGTPTAATLFRYEFLGKETGWTSMPDLPVPSFAMTILSAVAFVISIAFIVSGTPNAFIYFQF